MYIHSIYTHTHTHTHTHISHFAFLKRDFHEKLGPGFPSQMVVKGMVEQFYEDLQDLLELTPKKDVLFIIGDWNAKVGSQ